MKDFSEALFASLMLHRRQRDEGRRNDIDEDVRAARERQKKRS